MKKEPAPSHILHADTGPSGNNTGNITLKVDSALFSVSRFHKIFKIIHEFHVFRESRDTVPVNTTHVGESASH